jgi:hypothetical protein
MKRRFEGEGESRPFQLTGLTALCIQLLYLTSTTGELETEDQRTRAEVASDLRQLADQLDGGDVVTLELGNQA